MSGDFQYQFNKTISKIKLCNKDEIKIKFLPLLNRTFIVGNPKMPIFLTHDARMVCIMIYIQNRFLRLVTSKKLKLKTIRILTMIKCGLGNGANHMESVVH